MIAQKENILYMFFKNKNKNAYLGTVSVSDSFLEKYFFIDLK